MLALDPKKNHHPRPQHVIRFQRKRSERCKISVLKRTAQNPQKNRGGTLREIHSSLVLFPVAFLPATTVYGSCQQRLPHITTQSLASSARTRTHVTSEHASRSHLARPSLIVSSVSPRPSDSYILYLHHRYYDVHVPTRVNGVVMPL